MWAKIITIKITKDLNYFSLCALNLFNTRVSQFELNYWNKWLFHDILIIEMHLYISKLTFPTLSTEMINTRSWISSSASVELPSCRLQFQTCSNTPACNCKVTMNALISCFKVCLIGVGAESCRIVALQVQGWSDLECLEWPNPISTP